MKKTSIILLASVATMALVSCASTKVVSTTSEACNPVAVTEFRADAEIAFYNNKKNKNAVNNQIGKDASKIAGGGLAGKLAANIAKSVDKKVDKDVRSYYYSDGLIQDLDIQGIVFEELAKCPEISELIPADAIVNTKEYAKIKSEKSDSSIAVGGFKHLGYDKEREKKRAAVRKVCHEKLGANGYAEIYVGFGCSLVEERTDLQKNIDKVTDVLDKITFTKTQKEANTGKLYPTVKITVRIYDENGIPLPFPYRYENGKQIKGYASEKEAKKAKDVFNLYDYYYRGYAVGKEAVQLNLGNYNAEELYKLYTADLVREAARNLCKR